MLESYHKHIDPLPPYWKEEAVKQINQKALKKRPLVRHTFAELSEVATYIQRYGNLLNTEQVQRYILDQYTPTERAFIDALIVCKTKECRNKVWSDVRAELQRTRRIVLMVSAEIEEEMVKAEQERLKGQRKSIVQRLMGR